MSPIEREKYEGESSKSNIVRVEKKYTSFGVSFDEIDRQKARARQQQMAMELTIEEMLQTAEEQRSK